MNPHSPTKPWLDGVATDQNGYDVEAEAGDEGEQVLERDGQKYRVTVEALAEDQE